MSRRLYGQADYYRMHNHALLPVRWLPPEAINDCKFSVSSDVWALGVTMWEVFSYGEVPFAELNNFEMVSCAMAGIRPPRPKNCPVAMYELMQRCWVVDPDERIRPEETFIFFGCAPLIQSRTVLMLAIKTVVAKHLVNCIENHRMCKTRESMFESKRIKFENHSKSNQGFVSSPAFMKKRDYNYGYGAPQLAERI
ncbi:hypothetical protein TELCIR_05041, partial [Teladorsagia circumcincta]